MEKGKVVVTFVISAVTEFFAVITGWLGILAIPIYLLMVCNIIDYITGIIAAKYRNQSISSDIGLRGIFKKVGMWILVGIGLMLDTLINYGINVVGLDFALPFIFAIVIALWLNFNEFISIVENLNDIGVKMPKFLMPLLKNIKKKIDDTGKKGGK